MEKQNFDLVLGEIILRKRLCAPLNYTVSDFLSTQHWKLDALSCLQRRVFYSYNWQKIQRGLTQLSFGV